jgi:hypothetical protein
VRVEAAVAVADVIIANFKDRNDRLNVAYKTSTSTPPKPSIFRSIPE